jgi:hypothetical protein
MFPEVKESRTPPCPRSPQGSPQNSALTEPDLEQGVSSGKSPSRPRLSQSREAMSASPEPVLGKRDKTCGRARRQTVTTRPRSYQRFAHHDYACARCLTATYGTCNTTGAQTSPRTQTLSRPTQSLPSSGQTLPRPSSTSATCSPMNHEGGHSFKLWRTSLNLRIGSVMISGVLPPCPSPFQPSISVIEDAHNAYSQLENGLSLELKVLCKQVLFTVN